MDIPNFDDLLQQIKTKLWIAGLDYETPLKCYRFYICITLLTIVAFQELVYLLLYSSFDNFLKITQVLPCLCTCVTTLVKVVTLLNKREQVNELTNHLRVLFKDIMKNRRKKSIVRREMLFLKKLIKALEVLNAVLICVYNSSSLVIMLYCYLGRDKVVFDVPFPVAVPFALDWWLPWLVEYLMSIIAAFYCVLLFISFDSTYFLLSTHVFINLTVLSDNIKMINGAQCVNTIKDNIKRHQHIIRLSEILEDIFNIPNFFNIVLGSLQICFLGFTIMMGSWAQIPQCVFLLSSILLQLLMMSYFGENIMTESRGVGEAEFKCNWYNMDEESKKLVYYIILRSQRPQQLTAYNFTTISYSSFSAIISKSWSYFSILRTVYSPPKQ